MRARAARRTGGGETNGRIGNRIGKMAGDWSV
jgi:hypothetical protein